MGITNSKSATGESPKCENYVKIEKLNEKENAYEIVQTKVDEFPTKNFVLSSKKVSNSRTHSLMRIDQSTTDESPECENHVNNGKLSEKNFEWKNEMVQTNVDKFISKNFVLSSVKIPDSRSQKPKRRNQKTLYCEYCESKPIFDSICLLKAHFHVLHEMEGKRCIICAEIFNKNASYDTVYQHYYRRHRNNPTIYKESLKQLKSGIMCNFCQLKFENGMSLHRHIQKCHKKETFKCVCGSLFQNEITLKAHQTRFCKGKAKRRR